MRTIIINQTGDKRSLIRARLSDDGGKPGVIFIDQGDKKEALTISRLEALELSRVLPILANATRAELD